MPVLLLPTTIRDAQTICIGCNAGRLRDENDRPILNTSMKLNELQWHRPHELIGRSIFICDECLKDLQLLLEGL